MPSPGPLTTISMGSATSVSRPTVTTAARRDVYHPATLLAPESELMRALKSLAPAAQLVGVNNDVVISFTFGLGSALAGAARLLVDEADAEDAAAILSERPHPHRKEP